MCCAQVRQPTRERQPQFFRHPSATHESTCRWESCNESPQRTMCLRTSCSTQPVKRCVAFIFALLSLVSLGFCLAQCKPETGAKAPATFQDHHAKKVWIDVELGFGWGKPQNNRCLSGTADGPGLVDTIGPTLRTSGNGVRKRKSRVLPTVGPFARFGLVRRKWSCPQLNCPPLWSAGEPLSVQNVCCRLQLASTTLQ